MPIELELVKLAVALMVGLVAGGVAGGVYSAVIVVLPKLMAVARPDESIFATKTSLEPQVTKFVRSCVAGLPV